MGLPVEVTLKREDFDRVASAADVCVLFFRWRRGAKLGAHFVTVRHDSRGFVGYNTFRNSKGPDFYGESLDGFLRKHHYFGAVLIGIRDKR